MTRTFNEKIRCPGCGYEHTAETDFERWFRENPLLDSRSTGLVRFDLDMLLHKYKSLEDGKGSRWVQMMMFVEVKTFSATPSMAQRDTLSMLNQVMRNRRQNIHSHPRRQAGGQVSRVYSRLLRQDVCIKLFGGHLLQFDQTTPDNSSKIYWDTKEISHLQLVQLLTFENDPDRINMKLDHRRRSRNWSNSPTLFQP